MLKIFLLLAYVAVGIAHDGKSKIAGGTIVGELVGRKVINHGEFPFMAQIKLKQNGSKNLFHCSASIIEPDVLLTAAHCLDGKQPQDFIIFAGNVRKVRPKSRTQKRRARKLVFQEGYNNTISPSPNDIGVIFLTNPFETTKFVRPIELETANEYVVGTKVTAIGWGKNENGNNPQWLQKTDLYLIPNSDCQKFLNEFFQHDMLQVTDDMVCAINQDKSAVCEGDSGSPLVYNDRLIGAASFSFFKNTWNGERRCDTFYPSGYARLSNHIDWIHKTLEANPYGDT